MTQSVINQMTGVRKRIGTRKKLLPTRLHSLLLLLTTCLLFFLVGYVQLSNQQLDNMVGEMLCVDAGYLDILREGTVKTKRRS
jgi:hypothetical protein